ncbi:hypothetical protein NEF87_004996 [Candidatus Lokiarchaeum ossiferum]|uniref:BioF2-like acetyltransferase domain-containing protein n=1 Tax=Candidatus Lokiarchaeum ossiferum TaxID=2951803 RepID=A0ABY6HZE1_9ARCH|nr:hypothetical protein NEF87_004996 [Candidatus Lokiarchaeum sp. B-35]
MTLLLSNYQIIEISHSSPSNDFLKYLDRPSWFKENFQPIFDAHRQRTHGTLFLAKNIKSNVILGCIYCELEPYHFSYGKKIPIFGWLQADTRDICADLLEHVSNFVSQMGFEKVRGPINTPSLYGGWGIRTIGFENEALVNSAENDPRLEKWIEEAGWISETEYVSVLATEWDPGECPYPNMELKRFSIPNLLNDRALLNQLAEFVQNNFSKRLPDTTGDNKMMRMFSLLQSVEQGENYYILAFDKDTHEIIAAILEIPNIFDLWQNKKQIFSADIDTAIINKKYRNSNTFPWIYLRLFQKLQQMGVKNHIGATVWSKNIPALKSFSKGSVKVAHFKVFQKKL